MTGPVMVLGGGGMLGHKLFQTLSATFPEVACTIRAPRESRLARLPLFARADVAWGVDARDWPSLSALLRARRPAVVINALGIIKQRAAATDPLPSIQINALLPHQLAALVHEWGGRLIHISSDCVFSGHGSYYRETDLTDAVDLYGRSKALGEVTDWPWAVTLRTSMIGRELSSHHSLLDWFLAQNHGEVTGYRRVIYAGSTTNELSRLIADLITSHPDLHGLYHVASQAIAKHDLLRLIADAYGMDVRITPAADPVSDRSLNGDLFHAATGYVSPSWPHLVADLAADPTPYTEWLRVLDHD